MSSAGNDRWQLDGQGVSMSDREPPSTAARWGASLMTRLDAMSEARSSPLSLAECDLVPQHRPPSVAGHLGNLRESPAPLAAAFWLTGTVPSLLRRGGPPWASSSSSIAGHARNRAQRNPMKECPRKLHAPNGPSCAITPYPDFTGCRLLNRPCSIVYLYITLAHTNLD